MPPKPGYKTTEFWLMLLAVAFFTYVGVPETANWKVKVSAVVAALLTALGYGKFRSDQKSIAAETAPEQPPPRGFARLGLLVVVVLVAALLPNCAFLRRSPAIGEALARCASDALRDVGAPLVGRLVQAALYGTPIQWQAELAAVKAEAKDCAEYLYVAAIGVIDTAPPPDEVHVAGFRVSDERIVARDGPVTGGAVVAVGRAGSDTRAQARARLQTALAP